MRERKNGYSLSLHACSEFAVIVPAVVYTVVLVKAEADIVAA